MRRASLVVTLIAALALSAWGVTAQGRTAVSTQTANVWISPTGSDTGAGCARSATPVTAPDASTACATVANAYALANLGDTVGVLSGTYSSQSIPVSENKSGTAGTCDIPATGTRDTSACVSFVVGDGADATFGLTSCVSYWALETAGSGHLHTDLQIGKGDSSCGTTSTHDWIVRGNVDINHAILDGPYNAAFVGVGLGPMVNNASIIQCGDAAHYCPHDILFDGVTFHDYTRTNTTHMECLHVLQQGYNLTVRNSRFLNCAIYDTLIEPSHLNSANGAWSNVVLSDDFFDVPCSHPNPGDNCGISAAVGVALTNHDSLTNATFSADTLYGNLTIEDDGQNGTFTDDTLTGDVVNDSCESSGAAWAHGWTQSDNVYSGTSGAGTICAGDTTSLYSSSIPGHSLAIFSKALTP